MRSANWNHAAGILLGSYFLGCFTTGYYLVRVRTSRGSRGAGDKNLEIIPGMQAMVDIKTSRRTVLQYLLKPILRAKQTALRER